MLIFSTDAIRWVSSGRNYSYQFSVAQGCRQVLLGVALIAIALLALSSALFVSIEDSHTPGSGCRKILTVGSESDTYPLSGFSLKRRLLTPQSFLEAQRYDK